MAETPTQPPAVNDAAAQQPSTQPAATPRWDRRLQQIVIVIARLGLAYLFFSSLFWKMPPRFGCANNFEFPTANAEGRPVAGKSTGLCYFLGLESIYAGQPRPWLVSDLQYVGGQRLSIDLGPVSRLNGWFVDAVVKPNITWFGYVIFGAEALIALSMFLGLFTRLGGLIAIGISAQLMIGLANIPQPFEWEWSYNQMVLLSLLMFGLAPGRYFGLDVLLRPPLSRAAGRGNLLARLVQLLT